MEPEGELSKLAAAATQQVVDSLLQHFADGASAPVGASYKREMFKQSGYGCSLVIDGCLEDGDKKATIKTKLGRV